jgi:hypothetical protein
MPFFHPGNVWASFSELAAGGRCDEILSVFVVAEARSMFSKADPAVDFGASE